MFERFIHAHAVQAGTEVKVKRAFIHDRVERAPHAAFGVSGGEERLHERPEIVSSSRCTARDLTSARSTEMNSDRGPSGSYRRSRILLSLSEGPLLTRTAALLISFCREGGKRSTGEDMEERSVGRMSRPRVRTGID